MELCAVLDKEAYVARKYETVEQAGQFIVYSVEAETGALVEPLVSCKTEKEAEDWIKRGPIIYDDEKMTRHCEKCQTLTECEEIPLHGYSLWCCRRCAAHLYRTEQAV